MKQLLLATFVLTAFASCSGDGKVMVKAETSFDLGAVKSEIEKTNRVLAETFIKGDSSTLISLYHSQAALYPPNEPTMNAATMGSMAKLMPSWGVKEFTLKASEVMGDSEGVVESGTWEMRGDSAKLIDKGKYMAIWKEEGGKWKIFRDIWNSENPVMHTAPESE